MGIPKILDVYGHDYFVDIREQKLIDIHQPDHCIYFSSLCQTPGSQSYEGYYHIRRKQFIGIEPTIKILPAEVVFVKIPYLGEGYGQSGTRPAEKIVALITQLENTSLPEKIAENNRLAVLPKFTLHGVPFIVDIANQVLVESANPENKLSFDSMNDMGTHYSMIYDPDTRRMLQEDAAGPGRSVVLSIPQMKDLDPVRMANKYGTAISDLKYRSDVVIMGYRR